MQLTCHFALRLTTTSSSASTQFARWKKIKIKINHCYNITHCLRRSPLTGERGWKMMATACKCNHSVTWIRWTCANGWRPMCCVVLNVQLSFCCILPTGSSMACFGIQRIDRIILSKDIPWSRNPTDRTYAPTDSTSILFIVVMFDAIMNDGIKVKWKIESTLQSFCKREPSSSVVLFWKFQTLRWSRCIETDERNVNNQNEFWPKILLSTTSHYLAIDVLKFGGYSGR